MGSSAQLFLHEYVRVDSAALLDLGANLAATLGFVKYLVAVSPLYNQARFPDTTSCHAGRGLYAQCAGVFLVSGFRFYEGFSPTMRLFHTPDVSHVDPLDRRFDRPLRRRRCLALRT